MGYLALYRKYRPNSFEEVVGQEKVIKVINNAIINNKVSHAYLFSGPRGTGKTTTAKIIAKMVNCESPVDGKPCEHCSSCINISNSSDIVEIDAASNNGVDEIRELRDKVNLVPTSSKYKVYIIDEVHMLTTQAFNALLKTLEEPPSHVIFILATTEIYKIPLTVSSRCQKFQFTKISDEQIVKRLEEISKLENIDISIDALYEIARLSDGGLRDAINLLDQLTAYKSDRIELEDVYKINGSVSYLGLYNLLLFVINNDSSSIIDFVEDIDKSGKNITKFVEEIIIFLKDVLIFKSSNRITMVGEKNEKIKQISEMILDTTIFYFINELNDLLNKIKVANYPSILLIVSLLKLSSNNNCENNNTESKLSVKIEEKEDKIISREIISNNNISQEIKKVEKKRTISDENIEIRINNALATADKETLIKIKSKWNKISEYLLDDKYAMICGLLTDVNPIVAGSKYLILECKYNSNSQRLNELEKDISLLLNEIYDTEYKIVVISSDRWKIEREKYIKSKEKGISYILKKEVEEVESENVKDGSIDKLVELFGEDIIEYR